jgi:hypothetical protein
VLCVAVLWRSLSSSVAFVLSSVSFQCIFRLCTQRHADTQTSLPPLPRNKTTATTITTVNGLMRSVGSTCKVEVAALNDEETLSLLICLLTAASVVHLSVYLFIYFRVSASCFFASSPFSSIAEVSLAPRVPRKREERQF